MEGNIEALNLEIVRVELVKEDEGKIVIMDETIRLDITQVFANNPVILSLMAVEAGYYHQLRLIVNENCSAVIDGEEFCLAIPSGMQSGFKLTDGFEIPAGKFFLMDLDFIPEESVVYRPGKDEEEEAQDAQGNAKGKDTNDKNNPVTYCPYLLKPTVVVSGIQNFVGIFEGDLDLQGSLTRTIIQIWNTDGNRLFKAKFADRPDYELSGTYTYDSLLRQLTLTNLDLNCPSCSKIRNRLIDRKADFPDELIAPVDSWAEPPESASYIDLHDTDPSSNILYKKEDGSFNFSADTNITTVVMKIVCNESSYNGKMVVGSLINADGIHYIADGELIGNETLLTFQFGPSAFPNCETSATSCSMAFKADLVDDDSDVVLSIETGMAYGYERLASHTSDDILIERGKTNDFTYQPYHLDVLSIRLTGADLSKIPPTFSQEAGCTQVCWNPIHRASYYGYIIKVSDIKTFYSLNGGPSHDDDPLWDIYEFGGTENTCVLWNESGFRLRPEFDIIDEEFDSQIAVDPPDAGIMPSGMHVNIEVFAFSKKEDYERFIQGDANIQQKVVLIKDTLRFTK